MKKSLLLPLGIFAGLVLTSSPASANDEDLLDVLLKNGAINQAQHDELLENKEPQPTLSVDRNRILQQ